MGNYTGVFDYKIETPVCNILIDFEQGSAEYFFSMVDRDRFVSVIVGAIKDSGYNDINLKIAIRIRPNDIMGVRRDIGDQHRNRPNEEIRHLSKSYKQAYVKSKEFLSGEYIVYIEFTETLRRYYIDIYNDTIRNNDMANANIRTFIDAIEGHFKTIYPDRLYGILAHEITHLWHMKKSKALKYASRNKRRFSKISGGIDIEVGAFNNVLFSYGKENFIIGLNEVIGSFRSMYVLFRKRFIDFTMQLCTEGMATFMELYATGKEIDDDKIFRDALETARELKDKFRIFLTDFEGIIGLIRRAHGQTREVGNFMPLVKRSRDQYELHCREINKFFEALNLGSYSIGLLIPVTLYLHSDHSVEEIGKMKPTNLIDEYCKVSTIMGRQPVVSTSHFHRGAFDVRDCITEFNRLRKGLKI
ncbi:MAG: hypothetical protein QF632_03815 [Candidatus Woesearchaeota archaeon]|nr:hypothetical protein [Candidatus Woesearchaeota archaeon]